MRQNVKKLLKNDFRKKSKKETGKVEKSGSGEGGNKPTNKQTKK